MEQLNISGIQTFINIKALIGHQKESSDIVEGLSVSKTTVSNGIQSGQNCHQRSQRKKSQWTPVKLQLLGNSRNGITLKRYLWSFGDNEDISVDLLIGENCFEALEPVDIMPRQNDGPYAIRTALGWCVVG